MAVKEKLVVVCVCAAIAGGMRCYSALPGGASPALAPAPAAASARQNANKFMIPVLTVNPVTGGEFHRLPFMFERTGRDEPLKILIAEDVPSGSGNSIRSSVWLAAITAAMKRSDPMNGVRITVEFSGNIDGPSAGGVMCLSILSAMNGLEMPDDFAMTGTIMPDGTIGVVGGVALKMRAAIKRGCKRICIPMFCRFEKQDDGTLVDLFRIGEEDHVTVKPVRNIGEAYAFLHGLPPPPLPRVDEFAVRSLPRAVEDVLVSQYKDAEASIRRARREHASLFREQKDSVMYKEFLFDDEHVRKYRTGCLLSAVSSTDAQKLFWETVPAWDKNRKGFAREFPVLKEQAPFSKNVRREYIAAIKEIQKRYAEYAASFYKSGEIVEGGDAMAGFVRDADYLSEIAAQDEDVIEGLSFAAGMLLRFAAKTEETCGKDALDQSPDEGIAALYVVEEVKEFLRLCFKHVFESDSDVEMRKEIYRHYGQIRPNADLERVENLFYSAWRASDATLNSDIVSKSAEMAETSRDNFRAALSVKDMHFAGYEFGKGRVEFAHVLLDKPGKLEDRSYHAAAMTSINARMLASACALLVKYGPDVDGDIDSDGEYKCGSPEVLNYLIRRARVSALVSISECVQAGVPCLSALANFEEADGKDLSSVDNEDLLHFVLEKYWSAGLEAKALLMAFSKKPAPAR